MIAYKEARKIYYNAVVNEQFSHDYDTGRRVRTALYKVIARHPTEKIFKSKKEGKNIVIWRHR